MWKIVEGLVPNLSDPITCSLSDRRGRTCNFVKQNKSSLLPPLRKRIFKHVIRNNLTSQMLLTFATLNTLSFREIEKVKISHIYDLAE